MKRFLAAIVLVCAFSVSALAGDVPTGGIAPPQRWHTRTPRRHKSGSRGRVNTLVASIRCGSRHEHPTARTISPPSSSGPVPAGNAFVAVVRSRVGGDQLAMGGVGVSSQVSACCWWPCRGWFRLRCGTR